MVIYSEKCEQNWLKINNRGEGGGWGGVCGGGGGGINMSWVEKNRKINNWGAVGGVIIRDSRVLTKSMAK